MINLATQASSRHSISFAACTLYIVPWPVNIVEQEQKKWLVQQLNISESQRRIKTKI